MALTPFQKPARVTCRFKLNNVDIVLNKSFAPAGGIDDSKRNAILRVLNGVEDTSFTTEISEDFFGLSSTPKRPQELTTIILHNIRVYLRQVTDPVTYRSRTMTIDILSTRIEPIV